MSKKVKEMVEIAEKHMVAMPFTDEETREEVLHFARKYKMGRNFSIFAACVYNLGLIEGKREERRRRKSRLLPMGERQQKASKQSASGCTELDRAREQLFALASSIDDAEKIRLAAVFLRASV